MARPTVRLKKGVRVSVRTKLAKSVCLPFFAACPAATVRARLEKEKQFLGDAHTGRRLLFLCQTAHTMCRICNKYFPDLCPDGRTDECRTVFFAIYGFCEMHGEETVCIFFPPSSSCFSHFHSVVCHGVSRVRKDWRYFFAFELQ